MTTLLDLLFVASFAVAFPLFDYLVSWPAFHRRSRADPARARMSLWKQTIVGGWALVAVGTALFVITLLMNMIAIRFVRRYRQVYE